MYADPEWTPQAQAWFERRIRRHIINVRDNRETDGWCRKLLNNDDAVEWLVEWYCERALYFVEWRDGWILFGEEEFDPECPCGRWRYNRKKVNQGFYDVAREYQDTFVACDTLDEWLTALQDGKIRGSGPKEPTPKPELHVDAYWRREKWPRACRTCGESFKPDRAGLVRCPECRAKSRVPRHKEYEPVECKDCATSFRPHHPQVNRCPECRARWLAEKEPT